MRSGWLAALSVLVSAGAIAAYALLLGVAAVRNHPEGYVAAFAIAATLAGLAVALGRRWYAWTALVLTLALLLGGATFNFVLARISAALDAGGASCPATDQRGLPRPAGGACDIGPYENQPPTAPSNLHVGSPPPDFTLPDAGGRSVSLADYRGKKPVVLVFYRGYW